MTMGDLKRLARGCLAHVALIAIGALTYGNSLSSPFIFDDTFLIAENRDIRTILPLWRSPQQSDEPGMNGRPVWRLSFALNHALGGTNVRGYRIANLAIHVACGMLLLSLLRLTLRSPALGHRITEHADGLAIASSLVWLVHPLNSECVNYLSQRSESLMAAFYLVVLHGLARGNGDRRWLVVAFFACLVGTLTKEVMVTAPLVVLLYDRTFLIGGFSGALRRRALLYGGLCSTWLLSAALLWSRPHEEAVGFGLGVSAWEYALNQAIALVTYLRLVVWPDPLVLDYGIARSLDASSVILELGVVALLLGATAYALVRHRPVGFVGACFFVILSPTSSFIPIVAEVAAERRMYLPSMGLVALAVALGWIGLCRLRLNYLAPAMLLVLAAGLSVGTWARNQDYRSARTVWQTAVAARPSNARAHSSLGAALADESDMQGAFRHYATALRLDPTLVDAHYNLANALLQEGQVDSAIVHYQLAVSGNPADAQAHVNLGKALQQQGNWEGAETHYREALRHSPSLAIAHNNLAIVLHGRGQLDSAIEHFQEAVYHDRVYAVGYCNLARAHEARGDIEEALKYYEQALRLQPGMEQAARRLRGLLDQPRGR